MKKLCAEYEPGTCPCCSTMRRKTRNTRTENFIDMVKQERNMDNKPKHTPGPWIVGATNPGQAFPIYQDASPRLIAEVAPENAALIAAAPDLLAALKDAAHIIQQYAFYAERMRVNGRGFFPESRLGIGDNPAGNVLAAIAKAEGE